MLMADAVGAEGRVTAYEAAPDMAALVRANVSINGYRDRVSIVEAAACDRDGTQPFYICRDHKGSSSLRDKRECLQKQFYDEATPIQVRTVRLDSVCTGPVDLFKVDAEGAEASVLRGAAETIGRSPNLKIVLEFTKDRREIADLLAGHGFRLAPILPGKPTQPMLPRDLLEVEDCDVLAVRASPCAPKCP
jgi:FkbM family methyltransferase